MFFALLGAGPAWGQSDEGEDASGSAASAPGADALYEFGFHLGNLLPNQIGGVTEIMGLGGVRAGVRLSPLSYFEGGFITGNGEGQSWKNVHADFRMDMPVENLLALAYVGADAVYYEGVDSNTQLIFGGHVGGGLQMHLSGTAWCRADMKFGFSPGTSLYIGIGIEWRLGGSGSGGS
jgi:hypothetical protein